MKTNRFLTSLLSMVALFSVAFMTSCTEVEEDSGTPSLTLSTSVLAFDAEGVASDDNNGSVTITSNRDWVVVIPEAAQSWLTASTESGSGNGAVSFSMPASDSSNSAQVSIQVLNDWGVVLEEVVSVTQGDGGSTESGEVIFNEPIGTTAVAKDDSGYYPNVTAYTEWASTGTGASTVSFSGTNSSVRSSGLASTGYEGASGNNNVFFGSAPATFVVENISLTSEQTNLKLVFGGSRYIYDDKDSTFVPENMVVSVSGDGSVWSTLPYDVNVIDGESWVLCESNFSLKSATSSLYVKFECSEASVTRVDDVTLSVGNGGEVIDLSSGTTTPDNPDSSIDGDYVFDYETLGTTWLNGVEVTLADVVWYVDGMKNSGEYGNIGFSYFNNVGGSCYNKTAFGTGATKVIVDLKSGDPLIVYAGSSMQPTTVVTPTVDGTLYTYDIPASSPYLYFKNESEGYINLNALVIDYDGELGTGGGTTEPEEPGEGDTTLPEGDAAFTIDNIGLGALSNASSGNAYIGGYNFDFAAVSADATYGTIYIDVDTDGYITNTTAIENLTQVVIEGNGFVKSNLVVTVGETANPTTVLESVSDAGSGWGSFYLYNIPAGSKYIKFATNQAGSYDASVSAIAFYADLGSESGDNTVTEDVVIPEEPEDVDGTLIVAADFGLENAVAIETTTISGYTFSFAGTGSNPAKYYSTGNGTVRYYNGDVMTIASEDGSDITSIIFDTDGTTTMTANVGEMDTASKTWTGSASSIEFTASQTEKIESFIIK